MDNGWCRRTAGPCQRRRRAARASRAGRFSVAAASGVTPNPSARSLSAPASSSAPRPRRAPAPAVKGGAPSSRGPCRRRRRRCAHDRAVLVLGRDVQRVALMYTVRSCRRRRRAARHDRAVPVPGRRSGLGLARRPGRTPVPRFYLISSSIKALSPSAAARLPRRSIRRPEGVVAAVRRRLVCRPRPRPPDFLVVRAPVKLGPRRLASASTSDASACALPLDFPIDSFISFYCTLSVCSAAAQVPSWTAPWRSMPVAKRPSR